MGEIESENQSLRGKLDKRFGRTQFSEGKLGELISDLSIQRICTVCPKEDLHPKTDLPNRYV